MISISLIHEHSLDGNDFYTPEVYDVETAALRYWIKQNKPINFENLGWQGHSGKFDLQLQELIQYEE